MRNRVLRQKCRLHRAFLVICEGETERVYVEALKRQYRLPITIRTKVSGNAINSRLVGQYLKELCLVNADEYRVFYIYDCDVDCVVDKLAKLEGTPILTNPCIELWFLLHLKSHTRAITSEAVLKSLVNAHRAWNNYTKGFLTDEQCNMLKSNCRQALDYASRLSRRSNPSSDMPEFILALENEKNA